MILWISLIWILVNYLDKHGKEIFDYISNTNTALISSINGLGKTGSTFLINTLSLGIRIASVFLVIPRYGIVGYLWGLLASQGVVTVLALCILFILGKKNGSSSIED